MKEFDQIVKKIIEQVEENSSVVVAISGGSDSMCLFDLLLNVKKIKNINIICAHINHNVREESKEEFEFVRKYCESKKVIFEGMEINTKIENNFEREARKIRYHFFEQILEKYNSNYLFTAHHGDDLIETILMRIVRGSSLKGYSPFTFIKKNKKYKLLRPLIYVTKDDIIKYNNLNKIIWKEDYTNHLDIHTRNRYRKYILPKLKEEDKNVHLKFLQFSNEINEASLYIETVARNILSNIYKNKKLCLNEFKKYDHIIQITIIKLILSEIYLEDICNINNNHVNDIYDIINLEKPNITLLLPNNYKAVKNYDILEIVKKESKINSYYFEMNQKILDLPNGHYIKEIEETLEKSNFICRINKEDVVLPLVVRTKKDGDKMTIKNMQGTKKIKDIFINSKINQSAREEWPIVTDSLDNIIWLPGLKKTKYDKQIGEKYDIILKYYEGGIK